MGFGDRDIKPELGQRDLQVRLFEQSSLRDRKNCLKKFKLGRSVSDQRKCHKSIAVYKIWDLNSLLALHSEKI